MLALALALSMAAPAGAETASPYAPVITVNGLGISGYEIEQRLRFMQLLGAKGDVRQMAEKALIEDRLQLWKAQSLGIDVSNEAVSRGMSEFAARANLSAEEFIKALAQEGVDAQTYRDFVTAGMIWREVVKKSFAGRVQISDADVARALAVEAPRAERAQVLLSEVVIALRTGREAEAMAAARKVSAARSEAEFAALAKEYSSANTSRDGGRLDWMPLEALPPQVRQTVAGLTPGHASGPIEMPNSVAVFFMRGSDEGGKLSGQAVATGYATLLLGASGAPETAALAAKAAGAARRCDDLYSLAKGMAPERLERVEAARPGQIPQDIAKVLPRLDIGETRVLRRGPNDVLLMLCDRGRALNATVGETGPSRGQAREQLLNGRIAAMAEGLLAEMTAEAVIVRK